MTESEPWSGSGHAPRDPKYFGSRIERKVIMMPAINKSQSGVCIERDICESPAYFALSGVGSQLLTIFIIANCSSGQDRSCTLSYTEARDKFGLTRPRFTRGIDDLLAKGFISILHPGGFGKQDMVLYTLSDNWRGWEPGITFEARSRSSKSSNGESVSTQSLPQCPECGREGQCSDGCPNASDRKQAGPVADENGPVSSYNELRAANSTECIDEGGVIKKDGRITPVSNCDGEPCEHAAEIKTGDYPWPYCLLAEQELGDMVRCPIGRWVMPVIDKEERSRPL